MTRLSWTLPLLCLLACVDQIEIDLPASRQPAKVVEGLVERDPNHYVFWGQVSSAQNVTGTFFPAPLGAEIWIRYNDQHDIPIREARFSRVGIDDFHDRYGGDPAMARFQLFARLNGQTYRSQEQTITDVPKPDSLSVSTESRPELNASGNIVTNEYVHLLVHTSLENADRQRVSLHWIVTSAFKFIEAVRPSNPSHVPKTCYADYDIYRNDINIVSPQDYPGQEGVTDIEIAEAPNGFRFSTEFYFTVVQKSLNQASVEYWQDVKASNERSGNIYDVFPGRIRTNIVNEEDPEEQVHGYFHVSSVDTIRLKVIPDLVGFPVQQCALWQEPDMITPDDPDPCLNCLMLTNSSTEPPHYWEP